MTNLTPAQLEEFEQAFRHFDKDHSNSLSPAELNAALASLGVLYDDHQFETLFDRIAEGQDEASFEQFIRFMLDVTEDKSTPDQLMDSFRTIAGEKPYVTELDLKMCLVPVPVIEHLKQEMVPAGGGDGLDYCSYVKQMFK